MTFIDRLIAGTVAVLGAGAGGPTIIGEVAVLGVNLSFTNKMSSGDYMKQTHLEHRSVHIEHRIAAR